MSAPFVSTSQCHQDTFARRLIGPTGTFLDLGASHPVERSNTCSLERIGWTGWLVERDLNAVAMLRTDRTSPVHALDISECTTTTRAFYNDLLPEEIDYLSLDVDENTLFSLGWIPLQRLKFRVITIEHDAYRFGNEPRVGMRAMLRKYGYTLVCSNVMGDVSDGTHDFPFEDWWVDASRVTGWERYVSEGIRGVDFERLYPEVK